MGCVPSFSIDNSNKSSNTRITTDKLIHKSSELPSIHVRHKTSHNAEYRNENLEPFSLICLDENFDDNDKKLRSIIDYIYCFDDFHQCKEFITDLNQNHFLFFIISNEYFTDIISNIHGLSQIVAIYVFQDNRRGNYRNDDIDRQWTKRYLKVKDKFGSLMKIFSVFTEFNDERSLSNIRDNSNNDQSSCLEMIFFFRLRHFDCHYD